MTVFIDVNNLEVSKKSNVPANFTGLEKVPLPRPKNIPMPERKFAIMPWVMRSTFPSSLKSPTAIGPESPLVGKKRLKTKRGASPPIPKWISTPVFGLAESPPLQLPYQEIHHY